MCQRCILSYMEEIINMCDHSNETSGGFLSVWFINYPVQGKDESVGEFLNMNDQSKESSSAVLSCRVLVIA